jgi:inorganic triphosphatase YgiF
MAAKLNTDTAAEAPLEVELTLRLDPKYVSRLLRDPLLRELKQGRRQTRRLVSTYFDTTDFRLQQNRAALRVRQIGARRIQTLKLAPKAEDGVRARHEWEREIDRNVPDLRDIDDRHVRRLFRIDEAALRLEPIFVADITRSTVPLKIDGSDIELAVDRGRIRSGRESIPVCEAEIELKSGNVESVYKLAQELARRVPASIEPLSKAERGYALATHAAPTPRRAETVRLDRQMSAGQAFQIIARNCLLHLRANEASVRAAAVADGIHQVRVAIRRLRSALTAFGDALPVDEAKQVSRSVRWIAQRCGNARDLDVFLADIVEPLCARMPDETGVRTLRTLAESAREEAYAAIAAAIESKEYTDTLLTLEGWIEGGRWREIADDRLDQPVREFARAVLKRLHRKLVNQGTDLAALDETGLHRLRIRAKKLRYAAEFFRSLFGKNSAKSYIAAVVAVQERLGTFNDSTVAKSIVADLAKRASDIDTEAFARASGAALGWSACRADADLQRLPETWAAFIDAKPYWK